MSDNVDDIFVSLGGSLMRDLLADLQSGGGGGGDDETSSWSLEQLEQELAHLEQQQPPLPSSTSSSTFAAPSAASMVVSHAQERAAATNLLYASPPPAAAGGASGDAWSSSLERFTAMSLEQDFLAADSARKQTTTTTNLTDFSQAEDYNISEMATLSPPPGLMSSTTSRAAVVLTPRAFGMTDDALVVAQKDDGDDTTTATTPHTQEVEDQVAALRAMLHVAQPKVPPPTHSIPKPPPPTPQNSISVFPTAEGILMPNNTMYMGQPMPSTMMSPQMMGTGMSVVVPPGGIPIAAAGMPPPPSGPTAAVWQTPPKAQYVGPPIMAMPSPQPPPSPHVMMMPRVFCASHPAARPIPAGALKSKLMNARDIAYVVHSILKPLLLLGISETDYDIQYLRRLGDASSSSSSSTPNKPKDAQQQQDVQSRLVKAKDWSTKHHILGHVAKTNVTRPRALIATPTVTEQVENSEQRDRANLWKARIYVDQGYQAYLGLSGAWMASRGSSGGSGGSGITGGSIQMHLKKLLKCFGTTPPANPGSDYTVVEPGALELLLKLDKGKVLVARVIEQALLPPAAVLALLPHLLQALLASPPSSSSMMDVADDRVFRSLAFCIQTLPQLSPEALISSLQQVLRTDQQVALASLARMECVHALLLRGSALAAQPGVSNEAFPPEWNRMEGELMAILGG